MIPVKYLRRLFPLSFVVLLAFLGTAFALIPINRLEGMVWNPDRRPVQGLYIELQNENYFAVARVRTDSSGRFAFRGIGSGRYFVKVITSGTYYQEYTESVEVGSMTRTGSESVYMEINLKIDSRKIESGGAGIVDVVFAQEVPEEARRLYKRGLKELQNGDIGLTDMQAALKIFPTYFDALNVVGREYVSRREYQKSLGFLVKAIEVNQRSFSTFYALALACYQLNHMTEALEAARGATILQPGSVSAQLLYGTLLRLDRSYGKSEEALLEAKKLSKDKPVADIHWQLALLYNKLGRNEEAAHELERYLSVEPDARDRKEIQSLIEKLRKETKRNFVSPTG